MEGNMSVEERLKELGIELPDPGPPLGSFVPARRVGNLLYLSGQGPQRPDGSFVTGKVGTDLSLEEAVEAARLTGIVSLSVIREALGSLEAVAGIIKLLGMVNTAPGFNNTPAVINGCSDLLIEVFGVPGRHARSAVGMAELPSDISVEIEMIVECRPD
jgi:enamine deaminase RidA (YjgF/YER057c/UK114 family)